MREQSTSAIQDAIRSPSSASETLRRVKACFALPYYAPDQDEETQAEVMRSFVRALDRIPTWAMLRAFDAWERGATRRPTPGDIVILAEREMKPLADEMARRARLDADMAEPERPKVDAHAAEEILARAGFTPQRMEAVRKAPMARTMDEAMTRAAAPPKPHWSDGLPDDHPDMAQLRKSRQKALASLPGIRT